jgi:hypothetical protein
VRRIVMRGITIGSLLFTLTIPAGAIAQSPSPSAVGEPEALYSADANTQVFSNEDWCGYFTEGGLLMSVDVCLAQVALLLGDIDARLVPQALVPENPAPPGKGVTRKGNNHLETKSFRLAAGSYKSDLSHKGCSGAPGAFLLPVGKQEVAVPRSLADGSIIHDIETGRYTMQVIGIPKDFAGRACRWRVRLTPDEG